MIIHYSDFDYNFFTHIKHQLKKSGNRTKYNKITYYDIICAFDIETSLIQDNQSVCYIWQFQLGNLYTVIGRTMREAIDFFHNISKHINYTLCIYVHNLSFEFQFMAGLYTFNSDEVFVVDNRKILKCNMFSNLEFRCSYLLTNMNLATFTNRMKVEHQKLSGDDFNYSIVRYPWTELTEQEINYCINDVLGLVEALEVYMNITGDNLSSIPLTSTGFVRRDVKKAMRETNYKWRCSLMPDLDLYHLLREAFRGGDTHANRWYSNIELDNITCYDRSSSYPDIINNVYFPISKFTSVNNVNENYLHKLIYERNRALIFRCVLINVKLKNEMWGCPYFSRDKCRHIINGVYDNGRILSADSLETTITDVDFRIIFEEYIWDEMEIFDVKVARYGELPKPFTDCIRKYFNDKTGLKNVEGQEIYYNLSKALLNSIYGMCAQNPVKFSIKFDGEEYYIEEGIESELLAKTNSKAFLPYSWGIWVTAWARYRLHEGMWNVGVDKFVYADTDSIYYLGDVDWNKLNDIIRKRSIETNSYATDTHGIIHYLGVWEEDKRLEKFKTLGAKKYAYIENGKLKITIAGVNKDKGGKELEEHGGLSAFKDGFIFKDAGGTESVYNDIIEPYFVNIDGKELEISRNVSILPSTYTLGLTSEYSKLLSNCWEYRILKKRYKNNKKIVD